MSCVGYSSTHFGGDTTESAAMSASNTARTGVHYRSQTRRPLRTHAHTTNPTLLYCWSRQHWCQMSGWKLATGVSLDFIFYFIPTPNSARKVYPWILFFVLFQHQTRPDRASRRYFFWVECGITDDPHCRCAQVGYTRRSSV